MIYDHSVVLILPAHLRDAGNRVACALGHDELPGHTYSVPLTTGEGVTHYGCHTWAQQSFVDLLSAAAGGELPDLPWADYGLTEADVVDVVEALIASYRIGAAPREHWVEVLVEHGLAEASAVEA